MRSVPSSVVQSSCSLGHQSMDKESFSDAQTADPHPHLNRPVMDFVILPQDFKGGPLLWWPALATEVMLG